MDSFGLWYKPGLEGRSVEKNSDDEEKAAFELHINLWSKLRANGLKSDKTVLDVGIKVKNYKRISQLIFLCPFKIDDDEVCDLSGKMIEKSNADLIFNNDCELKSKDRYWIIENKTSDNDKENLLVFPFEQAVENIIEIKDVIKNKNSKIIVNFDSFKQYIETKRGFADGGCDDNLCMIKNVYIRFRIDSPELGRKIFDNIEPMNKSFQSGFISTQIIDFKLNCKRNIDDRVLAKAVKNEEKFVEFEKIHFLLMEPSNNDVVFMSESNTKCRNLENGKWDEYLNCEGVKNILVYHWKKEGIGIKEFNQLVKINYSKTNLKIILMYILVVIGLGMIGSAVTWLVKFGADKFFNLIFK